MTFNRLLVSTALCLLPAGIALAQDNFISGVTISDSDFGTADLFVTDVSVLDGNLCVGNSCTNTETFAIDTLVKLKNTSLSMLFEDGSGPTFPDRDWRLLVNETEQISLGGLERFSIEDVTAGTVPFTILGGAPENALWMDDTGAIGLGTMLPDAALHVVSAGTSDLLLAPSDPGVRSFRLGVDAAGFSTTIQTGAVPFDIAQDSANGALRVLGSGVRVNAGNFDDDFQVGSVPEAAALFVEASTGFLGVGTDAPTAPLHVSSDNSFAFFRIEATGATPNTAADMTYTQGPTGNGEYRINVVDGDGPEMRVNAEGFVIATTGFRVGSTDLTVPDYVFEPDYELRPLAEVATFIKQNKHLPDVPSAAQVADEGLDMTQMQMALLKKVEELTLYTLELEAARSAQQATIAAQDANIATLLARLDALETRVSAD